MPYFKIEVDNQTEGSDKEFLTKDQSLLIRLDGMKFKNISPEKAEGGVSNRCLQIAPW